MISALLYLQYHSFRNRLIARFKRLRQPKYLAGAIVGGAYFYFYFIRQFSYARGRVNSSGPSPEDLAFYTTIGALVFFVFVLLAWIIPHERAALAFTEAEVAFLFPAPISRRGLIHFKLLRSQTAILVTSFFFTLVSRRFGGGHAWIHAAGWWLVLSTLNLHLLGSSFARTMLLDRGIANWQRRTGVIIFLAALAIGTFLWARHTIPQANLSELDNFSKAQAYVQQVLSSGPLPYLLLPFKFVVRPYFTSSAHAFFIALWPALGLLALHYIWVARSDVAIEEASLEASKRLAEKIAAVRAGNWRGARKKVKARHAPFKLSPTGLPFIALLWKNLISAGQAFSARIWISLAAIGIGAAIALPQGSGTSGVFPGVGFFAGVFLLCSLPLGPQIVRCDFRQDLLLADVLKLFPLRGWQIALGELLAPAAILTGVQWLLLIMLISFFPPFSGKITSSLLIAGGAGAAIIFPALNLISLLIPNAAVLLFPAWFQVGKGGPQGIEATGQRIIFAFGQFVILVLALIPAGLVSAVAFFGGKYFIGITAAIPLASLAAAMVLGCEAALGFQLLGRMFERFDLSKELAA
jgi:ABC-2 type transport system permease protein